MLLRDCIVLQSIDDAAFANSGQHRWMHRSQDGRAVVNLVVSGREPRTLAALSTPAGVAPRLRRGTAPFDLDRWPLIGFLTLTALGAFAEVP